jgi:hypothetical protein
MKKFEYKTLVLPFRVGIFKQMILPSSQWGTSDSMVAILERTVE